jgi:hypothetical protein
MAGVITRSAHPRALWPGVKKWFRDSYGEHPMQLEQVFQRETSDKAYELDVALSSFGLAVEKPEGEPIQYDTMKQGYEARYTHVTMGLGYIVTREELEDGQYAQVSRKRAKQLSFSMRQTKEVLAAEVLNNAFDAASPIGDSQALISATHPELSGPQSNLISIAADLSEASLEDMLIQIHLMVNDRGLKISQKGKKLIVHPNEVFNATRILETNLRSGTDFNDVNAIRQLRLLPEGVMVYDYLTDPDAWFIKTDVQDGLKYYQRRSLEFRQDNDFDTENAKAKSTERYSFGASDWRAIFGSPGL